MKTDPSEIGCENNRWIELAENHVKWQALVLSMIKLQSLLASAQVYRKFIEDFSIALIRKDNVSHTKNKSHFILKNEFCITQPSSIA
jgi:hypothetical protein